MVRSVRSGFSARKQQGSESWRGGEGIRTKISLLKSKPPPTTAGIDGEMAGGTDGAGGVASPGEGMPSASPHQPLGPGSPACARNRQVPGVWAAWKALGVELASRGHCTSLVPAGGRTTGLGRGHSLLGLQDPGQGTPPGDSRILTRPSQRLAADHAPRSVVSPPTHSRAPQPPRGLGGQGHWEPRREEGLLAVLSFCL